MLAAMDANSKSVLLTVHLGPLEAIGGPEMTICSSTHFLFTVVRLRDEGHVWECVYGQTIAVTSNGLCVQAGESGLCDK